MSEGFLAFKVIFVQYVFSDFLKYLFYWHCQLHRYILNNTICLHIYCFILISKLIKILLIDMEM